jgi:hypothetical protein
MVRFGTGVALIAAGPRGPISEERGDYFMTTAKWNRARGAAVTSLCLATLGIGLTSTASADQWDKKTIVTFNAPVEVPGKVLLPGT